ncbi:MAG: zinc ribbon domain-containing protein [archaeon]|nr:zinc ribbon domain-containing protein [archaeon]MCP8313889.1 zinc ribbon domain-containing protein [archaeon]
MVKCKKCGFDNQEGLKFCGNCGAKLGAIVEAPKVEAPKFEGLALLHITGSIYLLISLVSSYSLILLFSNALVGESYTFMILYLVSGLLGLYAGYEFYTGKISKYLKMISVLAIALGLASTSILFWLGLLVMGVIGPAWAIFLINAWILWKERAKL